MVNEQRREEKFLDTSRREEVCHQTQASRFLIRLWWFEKGFSVALAEHSEWEKAGILCPEKSQSKIGKCTFTINEIIRTRILKDWREGWIVNFRTSKQGKHTYIRNWFTRSTRKRSPRNHWNQTSLSTRYDRQ